MKKNEYADKAMSLVMNGKSLFITGKAGTGKTTLLKDIRDKAKKEKKNVVVLSPTGVAAKNAEGVTIHSFLHMPLTPYLPNYHNKRLYKLSHDDANLIQRLDMIIIDEISMVRCDILDMMDDILQHYRHNNLPFGGIQMVFIGDLYQLMPVAKKEEHDILKKHYKSLYFFSSKVYEAQNYPLLELRKVYRQTEDKFVKLLDHIRIGQISQQDLTMLQKRYKSHISIFDKTIRLTTHNWKAKRYNNQQLDALDEEEMEYKAFKDGYYPFEEFPTSKNLLLKKGARVMFTKNASDKSYVNGSLGCVSKLDKNEVEVKLDTGKTINVKRQEWKKLHYVINKKTKEITTEVCGTFSQIPLKLAWAITIHKSQGLTFDKIIIDADKAFTYGQTYVALSRCRTLKGITLATPISKKGIKVDPCIVEFMKKARQISINEEENDEEINEDNNDWTFVKDIFLENKSDYFFKFNCKVGMAEDGYYLRLDGEFIKLTSYAKRDIKKKGWISLRPTIKHHLNVVHIANGKLFPIGTFIEEEDRLVYITPDKEVIEITFNQ